MITIGDNDTLRGPYGDRRRTRNKRRPTRCCTRPAQDIIPSLCGSSRDPATALSVIASTLCGYAILFTFEHAKSGTIEFVHCRKKKIIGKKKHLNY